MLMALFTLLESSPMAKMPSLVPSMSTPELETSTSPGLLPTSHLLMLQLLSKNAKLSQATAKTLMEMIMVTMVTFALKSAIVTMMMRTAGTAVMTAWRTISAAIMVATMEVITAVTTEAMVTTATFVLKNANVTMMMKTAGMFASNAGKKPKEIKEMMMVLTMVSMEVSSLELIANVNAPSKILHAGRPAMSASMISSAKMVTAVTMAVTMAVTTAAMATMVATMAVMMKAMVTTVTFVLKNAIVTTMMRTAGKTATIVGQRNSEADLTGQMATMVTMATSASTSATAITMMKTAGMAATTAGKKLTAVMMAAGGKSQNVQSHHAMTIANGGMKNAGKSTIGVSVFSDLWLECHNS